MEAAAAPPRLASAKNKPARARSKISRQGVSSGKKIRATARVGSCSSLKAKEEEYRRLNAELEAKTAELVKEAEYLVKDNLSLLCDLESSSDMAPASSDQRLSTSQGVELSSSLLVPPQSHTHITTSPTPRPSQTHSSQSPPHTTLTHSEQKKMKKPTKQLSAAEIAMATNTVAADVDRIAVRAEQELDEVEWNRDTKRVGNRPSYHGNNILPDTADDMGPEALTRFLKAKLRVIQEEVDQLCQELAAKERQLSSSEAKVKELLEDNNKLKKTHLTVQNQAEKFKGQAESLQQKCGGLEAQLVALRKEVEVMQGHQMKARSQHGAVEVRLNRALEEVERYKTELTAARARSEDLSKAERGRVDQLTSENRQLERQRNQLMTAFKKQMKLIDILKRQKMHIEGAKMLSFTEEEFVKALDWQAT